MAKLSMCIANVMRLVRVLKRLRRFFCIQLTLLDFGNLSSKIVVCLGYKFVLWSPLERHARLSSQVKSDQCSRYD